MKGLDIDDWLDDPRKHQKLLWIIDGLPSASHFGMALRNDPDQIKIRENELAGDDIDDGGEWHPSGEYWDDLHEMVAIACEALVNQNNDGKSDIWRMPRPVSLMDDARQDVRVDSAMAAFADLGFNMES